MKVAVGCDHAGFPLKETVIAALRKLGAEVVDFGTHSLESVDYPDFGERVGRAVASGEVDRGVVICGTGIGVSIAANKVPGVRAALCHDVYSARMSRAHNDANVLAMGARVIGPGLAEAIVEAWLTTSFEGGRHARACGQDEPHRKSPGGMRRTGMASVHVVDHPLIQHKLSILRKQGDGAQGVPGARSTRSPCSWRTK